MKTKVKICGITRIQDAEAAVRHGAWAIGLVFHPKSSRRLTIKAARKLVVHLPAGMERIGVFGEVNLPDLSETVETVRLSAVQFHSPVSEILLQSLTVPYILRVSGNESVSMEKALACLMDASGELGGTGKLADWQAAKVLASRHRLLLAGGLSIDNVQAAMREVNPWGLDISSGLEVSPGIKSKEKIEKFLKVVERFDEESN